MEFARRFDSIPYDQRDPDPWLALYLDRSVPIDDDAKAALLLCNRSRSRQFLLPLVRPVARLTIILIQLLKVVIPNRFTSSKLLLPFSVSQRRPLTGSSANPKPLRTP